MTIGERIKARRNELMLSQRDLCEKMGYSNHSTIGKIEAGKVDIPQSRIVQFADVLGVSIAYLMGWEESDLIEDKTKQPTVDAGLSEKRKALIDFAKSVPEDKAEMILRVMKSIVEAD